MKIPNAEDICIFIYIIWMMLGFKLISPEDWLLRLVQGQFDENVTSQKLILFFFDSPSQN